MHKHIHTPHKEVQHEISVQQSLVKDQGPVKDICCHCRTQVTYQKELWRGPLINQVRIEYLKWLMNYYIMTTIGGTLTLNL